MEGLNEVGADVLDLLEFFISRYKHVNEANFLLEGPEKDAIACTVHGNLSASSNRYFMIFHLEMLRYFWCVFFMTLIHPLQQN